MLPRRPTLLALLLLASALPPGAPAQGLEDRPDLVATALVAPPGNLTGGAPVAFTLSVANAGNASAPATNVTFYVDADLLGNATLPALENGTATNVTSPTWNATEGNHTIRAVIDPEGAVVEVTEANNELAFTLLVGPPAPPLPDLIVLDAGPAVEPELGTTVSFQARLLNTGAGDAVSFVVRFVLDDAVLGNRTVQRLGAGEGVTIRGPAWNVTGGNHTLEVLADARREVEETSEANNRFDLAFAAARPRFTGPDLRVVRVALDPAHPLVGMPVKFLAHLENAGSKAGSFLVLFRLDNRTLHSEHVAGLGVNESLVVASPAWVAGVGNHTLVVEADLGPGNDSASMDNVLPVHFRIPPRAERPDLVLDLLVVPAVLEPGAQVRFAAVVRNNGSWPAPASAVRFTVDGAKLGDAPLPALEPGETTRVTAPAWNATAGPHVLHAKADPGGAVPEANNANNALARNLTVAAASANLSRAADLAVKTLAWDPAEPKDGQEVVLQATIVNAGNGTAGPFAVEFLVDGQLHDQQLAPGIGSLDVVVVSRPWTAKPGRHTLGVRLDAAEQHREPEEANNLRYGVLEVPPPGLPFAREVPDASMAFALTALAAAALAARRSGRLR